MRRARFVAQCAQGSRAVATFLESWEEGTGRNAMLEQSAEVLFERVHGQACCPISTPSCRGRIVKPRTFHKDILQSEIRMARENATGVLAAHEYRTSTLATRRDAWQVKCFLMSHIDHLAGDRCGASEYASSALRTGCESALVGIVRKC